MATGFAFDLCHLLGSDVFAPFLLSSGFFPPLFSSISFKHLSPRYLRLFSVTSGVIG